MHDRETAALIQQAVEVAILRAQNKTIVPMYLGGVILAVNEVGTGIHTVQLDGDQDTVLGHDVTTGSALVEGDRIAIVAVPPHQFWIIGRFQLDA